MRDSSDGAIAEELRSLTPYLALRSVGGQACADGLGVVEEVLLYCGVCNQRMSLDDSHLQEGQERMPTLIALLETSPL